MKNQEQKPNGSGPRILEQCKLIRANQKNIAKALGCFPLDKWKGRFPSLTRKKAGEVADSMDSIEISLCKMEFEYEGNKNKKPLWWYVAGAFAGQNEPELVFAIQASRLEDAVAKWHEKAKKAADRTDVTIRFTHIVCCGASKPKVMSDAFNVVGTGIFSSTTPSKKEMGSP